MMHLNVLIFSKLYGPQYHNMILELNALDDRGIDVVRQQIQDFASTQYLHLGCLLCLLFCLITPYCACCVCALGAVAAKHGRDDESLRYYLAQFEKIKLPKDLPNELLYGRVGFRWACLFLNKHLGQGTLPSSYTAMVVDETIKNGSALGRKGKCPLMFEWYREKYWGAAHGFAGIMHVLLDMELKPDELEDVRGALKYVIHNRFPSGNYPASEEDKKRDVLVHWCHGAPGVALTLVKAAKVFGIKNAAMEAGEVVWNRGLLKRVGICHGISGIYHLTGNIKYLYRAKAFPCFMLDRAHKLISRGEMHGGDIFNLKLFVI